MKPQSTIGIAASVMGQKWSTMYADPMWSTMYADPMA